MMTKLVQFTLLIPVNGRLREFNFRQRGPEQYDGNTPHENGDRFYFKLIKDGDHWIFEDALLPTWLRESESQIARAISQHRESES